MQNVFQDIKQSLSEITIFEIIKKIEDFRKLDFKKISDDDLFNEIRRTISVESHGIEKASLIVKTAIYPSKTRFYRVRKVQNEDHYLPLKAMTFEQDAWNPPTDFITKSGRLNKINESLLYVSPSPNIAVEEIKIKNGERFCLIVYEALTEVRTSVIGQWEDFTELNSEENLKMRIISNFLNDEFTRDVGEGTEFLYRTSERIAKDYFDSPPQLVDAWCYPSIVAKKSVNLCFRPEKAKKILKLKGVQICNLNKVNDEYLYNVQVIASGFNEDKKFNYYKIDSPICQDIFPEIQLRKE